MAATVLLSWVLRVGSVGGARPRGSLVGLHVVTDADGGGGRPGSSLPPSAPPESRGPCPRGAPAQRGGRGEVAWRPCRTGLRGRVDSRDNLGSALPRRPSRGSHTASLATAPMRAFGQKVGRAHPLPWTPASGRERPPGTRVPSPLCPLLPSATPAPAARGARPRGRVGAAARLGSAPASQAPEKGVWPRRPPLPGRVSGPGWPPRAARSPARSSRCSAHGRVSLRWARDVWTRKRRQELGLPWEDAGGVGVSNLKPGPDPLRPGP